MTSRPLPYLAGIVALAAVYFGAAKLGLSLAFVAEQVTVVWPPTGIALAALLLFGYRLWPGIALGAFLANWTVHEPPLVACGIAMGNTLEAVVGVWLLHSLTGTARSLGSLKAVLGLGTLAAGVSTMVSATLGVTSLCLGDLQEWSAFGPLWWTWWLGDAMGDLVMAPVLLTWATEPRVRWRLGSTAEAVALLAGLGGVSAAVFSGAGPRTTPGYPLEYAIFPFVIWAALRFGQRGSATVTLVALTIAVVATASDAGPFTGGTVHESLVLLHLYMAAVAVTALLLGAAMTERQLAERRRTVGYAITAVLAESPSLTEAVPRILRVIGDCLNWDVGALWLADESAHLLRCVEVWHCPPALVTEFEAVTLRSTFAPGIGLPGRVWSSGLAAWVADVTQDSNFPRAPVAVREGLHGAFGFPILIGTEVLGVIEFFNRGIQEPDEDLLNLTAAIGGQIGLFIERKRAEEELRHSQEELRHQHQLLRTITDNAASCLCLIDPRGHATYVSPAFTAVTGYTLEEIQHRPVHDAIHHHYPDGRPYPLADCPIDRAAATPVPLKEHEDVFIRKDGTFFPVRCSLVPLQHDGKTFGGVAEFRDITAEKRAEEKLRFQAHLLDSIGQAAIATRPDGTIFYWNRFAETLYGWSAAEVLGRNVLEVVPARTSLGKAATVLDRLGTGESWSGEFQVRHRNGTTFAVLATDTPVCDEQGKVVGIIGISTDITERKRAEEALREAHRRKDEFLAMLAHELRNPLAPIRNAVHILKTPGVDEAVVGRARELLERQVQHLVRLVDDLLDVSRIMRGRIDLRKERIDLATAAARAVEAAQPVIEAGGHQLTVAPASEPILLEADPMRLAQVIGNLLHNAAKYTERGGHIWLTATREGDDAVVRVRDTGVGIAAEMLARVFDLFVQADGSRERAQGGMGVGLTLVRSLVEMHGGSVRACSEGPGKGSEFIIRLPALPRPLIGETAADVPASSLPDPHVPRRRILVVDDNQDAAESLAVLLRLAGQDVRVAYSGVAALEAARAEPPEVVFLDIGMPGMDGCEVARRFRRQPALRRAVLVALTGWGQEEDRRRTQEAGLDHHLLKPADPAAVQELLASLGSL